ncbi:hypothetical protein ACS3YM_13530 [Nocardia sp. N13]|uniref:hypothetical protein n=1 Tax=Nocardioides sp. N13(2025) TaxID=3453405 RepID=UPI003F76246E
MPSRRAVLAAGVLVGLALVACSAESSPAGEDTARVSEVAPDLVRLADEFVAYAVGDASSFPHWESVSMAIGGEGVKSIDDIGAALSNRDIWKMCPGDWEGYAAASCPVDLLGPITSAEVNGAPLVYEPDYGEVTCAPLRTGPLPDGRLVVVRPVAEHRTCATDFALALVADERGRLRSVDLTLSAP